MENNQNEIQVSEEVLLIEELPAFDLALMQGGGEGNG